MSPSLFGGFLSSLERYPSSDALWVDDKAMSYEALAQRVSDLAATIRVHNRHAEPLGAVLAHRSLTAYSGVLGVLASGRGYVPLNPKFPLERTREMLVRSECDVLVAGEESVAQLPALLADVPRCLTVLLPDGGDLEALSPSRDRHRIVSADEFERGPASPAAPTVSSDDVAYLLFTSGSTGKPKGVPVRQGNVASYLRYVGARYGVGPEDRVSQTFDLTFDLSVHDMFLSWHHGACLYCVPESSVMAPAKFIRDRALTLWFSVPSVVAFLRRLRLLRPSCFPSLRWSLFCGEKLQ